MTRFEDKVRRAIATLDKTVCGVVMKLVEVSGWFEVHISIEDVQGRKASINYNIGASSEAWATEKMNASRTKEFRIAVTNVSNEIVGQLVRQRAAEKATTTTQETTSMEKPMTAMEKLKADINNLGKKPEPQPTVIPVPRGMMDVDSVVAGMIKLYDGREPDSIMYSTDNHAIVITMDDYAFDILDSTSEQALRDKLASMTPLNIVGMIMTEYRNQMKVEPKPEPVIVEVVTAEPVAEKLQPTEPEIIEVINDHLANNKGPYAEVNIPEGATVLEMLEAATEAQKELEQEQPESTQEATEEPTQPSGEGEDEQEQAEPEVESMGVSQKVWGPILATANAKMHMALAKKGGYFDKWAYHSVYLEQDGDEHNEHMIVIMGANAGRRNDVLAVIKSFETSKEMWDWLGNGRKSSRVINKIATGLANYGEEEEGYDHIHDEPVQTEPKQTGETVDEVIERIYKEYEGRAEERLARDLEELKKLADAQAKRAEEFFKKYKDFDWTQFYKRPTTKDKERLFEILGVKEGDDVKRAYRSWMKDNHPDRNPNADLALVQEVNALMDKLASEFSKPAPKQQTDVTEPKRKPSKVERIKAVMDDMEVQFPNWREQAMDPNYEATDEERAEADAWFDKWINFDWTLFDRLPVSDDKARLFRILGIKDGDDVKRAHRRWMTQNHPDRNPDSDLSLVQEVNALMDKLTK